MPHPQGFAGNSALPLIAVNGDPTTTASPDRCGRRRFFARLAISASGAGKSRRGARAHAPDAPVRQCRSQAAYRSGLLLDRAHARARADRDHAERALLLRRRRHQHGRRRMLDLRYLAPAPRASTTATQSRVSIWSSIRSAATVSGTWSRVDVRIMSLRQAGPRALRHPLRTARSGARVRIGQSAEGDESVGIADAYRRFCSPNRSRIRTCRCCSSRPCVSCVAGRHCGRARRCRRCAIRTIEAVRDEFLADVRRLGREIMLRNEVTLTAAMQAMVTQAALSGGSFAPPRAAATRRPGSVGATANSIDRYSSSRRRAPARPCCSRRWPRRQTSTRSATRATA